MAVGAAVVVTGTLLPWVRTGGRRRNSYDVLELVERLGFAPDGAAATALRWWPVVTVLVVLAVVATWWGWPRLGGATGLVAAGYAGTMAAVVAFRGSATRPRGSRTDRDDHRRVRARRRLRWRR